MADSELLGGCAELEPYALQVQGESMAPEFEDGCIIIIDPGYPPVSGAYVIVEYGGGYIFRQIVFHDGHTYLNPLNPRFPAEELTGPYRVKGAVVQSNHRRRIVHYEFPEAGKILRREKFRGRRVRQESERT